MKDKTSRMYALLDRQARSDLSIKDFCAAEAITYATLHYWRRKRRREQVDAPAATAGFINLRCSDRLPAVPTGLRVELPGGLVLQLSAGNPIHLADLLHHLDRRCAEL